MVAVATMGAFAIQIADTNFDDDKAENGKQKKRKKKKMHRVRAFMITIRNTLCST